MAINERLVHTASAAGTGNAGEEGLILHLDANDVDSYDGDGSVWYDITNHEYTPAVDPSDSFNTVTYTGNGSASGKDVTGVGFQPDLVWIKSRETVSNSTGGSNMLVDSLRPLDESLRTEGTGTPIPYGLTSLDIDGFTLEDNYLYLNQSGIDYVAWCFKGGGATDSTNIISIDGTQYTNYADAGLTQHSSAPSQELSVNNELGFSIVKANNVSVNHNNKKLTHGLGQEPEMSIYKFTNTSSSWYVYHKDLGKDRYLVLNATDAQSSVYANRFFVDANHQNALLDSTPRNFVIYNFISKRGVSKVGSFIGTGTSNKVYTGFEPAWIMVKRTTSAGAGWYIVDNKRDTNTNKNKYISANSNAAEATSGSSVTFNTDGFTFNGSSYNTSGQTHIYLAFAAEKATSLIDDTDLELHLDPASYSGSGTTWSDLANSNDGTISGAYYDEELGDWFDFDGSNDNVTISPTSFNSASALTVEAWLNKDNNNAFYTFTTLRGTASNSVKFLLALNINGTLRLDSASGTNFLTLYSGNAAYYTTVGKWHHVAASIDYNSKDWAIYLDGKKIANGTNASIRGATQFNPDLFAIGMNYNQQYFNGQIGQYRVYDSVLSETDIRQNFNFTKNDYPNGFNGTLTSMSGSNWNSSGYFNLTTNDYIDLTGNAPFSSSTTQTDTVKCVTGWIKPDTSTSRVHLYSVSSTSSSNDFLQIGWFNDLSLFRVNVRNGTSNQDSLKDVTITPTTNWVHIVVQVTDTTTEIYFNGNSQTVTFDNDGSGTNTSWISFVSYASGVKHSIGRSRVVNPSWSDGSISKVKIYDKVLTQAEITALYDEGE